MLLSLLALLAGSTAALLPQQALQSRRAVISGAASVAILAAPWPAVARSKEKAAEKMAQKATAKEAREAMREYKYAPRPELVGNAETGYSYKEGTVKEGSTGELSGYFKEKGATIQAEYAAERAKAVGKSSAEADRVAKETLAKFEAEKKAKQASKKELSEDARRIIEFCKDKKDLTDVAGRPMCK